MTAPTLPQSPTALEALKIFEGLQAELRAGLDALSSRFGDGAPLLRRSWLRDEGRHGGGWRFEGSDRGVLNRGSLNISAVHYDDLPERRLRSATALSCIIHPAHPRAPSIHMHISWTELREGPGGWRLMADLNPSLPNEAQRARFTAALREALAPIGAEEIDGALAQGDRYFYIPALGRHRGVSHCYLEQWRSGDPVADRALAGRFGAQVSQVYLALLEEALSGPPATAAERSAQLDYHSLYFLQVLTLDRGTSSGILVHDQNDVGILGSLPQRVNPTLLTSWIERLPAPQDTLLQALCASLPEGESATLTAALRVQLAATLRAHYRAHPEALALQARGAVLPPTVENHGAR